jgi:hypothetical protein
VNRCKKPLLIAVGAASSKIEAPFGVNRAETEALRCPECGQLDELLWISDDDSRRLVFAEAERRWLAKLEKAEQLSHSL